MTQAQAMQAAIRPLDHEGTAEPISDEIPYGDSPYGDESAAA